MKQINSYQSTVFIGEDVFEYLEEILKSKFTDTSKKIILVDTNTLQHCLPVLINNVPILNDAEILEVESGEDSKSFEILSGLIEALADMNANRKSLLLNLGGGVISDLGGLLASLYKRGINYINVPTSLLAMADASVGGKVAVNVNHIKNIAGVFNPPQFVFINPVFLQTLDEREYLSGYAEIIKHALIYSKEHWNLLKSSNLFLIENWTELLYKSVSIKNDIVLKDPLENNERKLLNLGHTIGHGIESLMMDKGMPVTHGEAVAAGILIESRIALEHGLLNSDDFNSLQEIITKYYSKVAILNDDIDNLISYLYNDKKNENDAISFVLLSEIGKAHINKTASIEQIKAALEFYIKLD
ncbi:MAG: 3-dehydroquinate synthase [Bacteroidia bacterium]